MAKARLRAEHVTIDGTDGQPIAALRVHHGGRHYDVTAEDITPAVAHKLVAAIAETGANPRKQRSWIRDRYAADMAAGNWAFPVDFVGFNHNGDNVNGQHRLAACVESQKPFPTLIVRGVEEDAVEALDRGLKRQLSDALLGRGLDNARDLQSAIKLLWKWDNGWLFTTRAQASDAQSLAHLEANEGLVEAVRRCKMVKRAKLKVTVMSVAYYRASLVDPDAAGDWLDKIITGIGLEANDPILHLRDLHTRRVKALTAGSQQQVTDLAYAIKVWNAWIQNKPMGQLRWSHWGRRPERFPDMVDRDGNLIEFEGAVEAQHDDIDADEAYQDLLFGNDDT